MENLIEQPEKLAKEILFNLKSGFYFTVFNMDNNWWADFVAKIVYTVNSKKEAKNA